MQNAIGALLLRPPPMLLVWIWFQIYTNSEPLHGITINVFFGLYLCTFLFDSSSSSPSSSFSIFASCWCCFFYCIIWYVVRVTAYNTAYTDHGRLSDRHMKHLWDSVVVTFVRVFIYIKNRSFFCSIGCWSEKRRSNGWTSHSHTERSTRHRYTYEDRNTSCVKRSTYVLFYKAHGNLFSSSSHTRPLTSSAFVCVSVYGVSLWLGVCVPEYQ